MTLEELKAMHTLGTWTQGVEKGDHEDYNVECDGDVLMCGMQSTDAVEEVIALHNYFPALIRIIEAQREALERIERWFGEFPATGEYWDKEMKCPMSYAALYGSNGERDYMREVARNALKSNSLEATR